MKNPEASDGEHPGDGGQDEGHLGGQDEDKNTAPCGQPEIVRIERWQQARETYRSKHLRQAMYDEGAVIMADCLLVLHGVDHRTRRRVENRLFRRETFAHWEREVLGGTIDAVLKPFIKAGRGDLRAIGYRAAISLTATIAGVDHDPADPDHTGQLEGYVRTFSAGATLAHSTRDRDQVRAEVRSQMAAFSNGMLAESLQRRTECLERLARGETDENGLPRDVATLLLRHADEIGLSREVIEREICFYLQAGAHSTADAFTHTLDELFRHGQRHPEDLRRAATDKLFAQRCMHESLRLNPASPVAWREPLQDVRLSDGTLLTKGCRVIINLTEVNRDPEVWGARAGEFNPHREVPEGCNAWGLSFGGGAHACIGAELDGGMEQSIPPSEIGDDHLYGTVALMVSAVLAAGGRPDPQRPPVSDPHSERPHYSEYPVVFGDAAGSGVMAEHLGAASE